MSLFGLRYPIWQAPTGSIAGPELAVAVAEAGGMGAMGMTWTPSNTATLQVRQVIEATDKPFQVNFALAFPPDSLEACLQAGAKWVSFSWGDPAEYVPLVRKYGAKFGVQVVNVAGAKRAVEIGADFLVCQGNKAGGHVQSSQSLSALLPRIRDAAGSCPVIAAGGLGTGTDARDIMNIGAAGAMFGTRFVAAEESRAHAEYKRRLVEAESDQTVLTVCFDGGWTQAAHGVLRNFTLDAWEAAGSPPNGRRPGENEIVGYTADGQAIFRYEDTAPRVGFTGEIEAMCLYAGNGVCAVKSIQPAAEIVAEIVREIARSFTTTG